MPALTMQAALALALQCAPSVDPHMIVAIGERESGLDPLTLHDNTSGQSMHGEGVIAAAARLIAAGHSVDLGAWQLNSHNLGLLGLSLADTFDPCRSVAGAARLIELYSRYNTGSPSRGVDYAAGVIGATDRVKQVSAIPSVPTAAPRPAAQQFDDQPADPVTDDGG